MVSGSTFTIVYYNRYSTTANNPVNMYRIGQAWTSSATWTSPWSAGGSYTSVGTASQACINPTVGTVYTFSPGAGYDFPYGVLFKGDDESSITYRKTFYSNPYPTLAVTYTPPSGTANGNIRSWAYLGHYAQGAAADHVTRIDTDQVSGTYGGVSVDESTIAPNVADGATGYSYGNSYGTSKWKNGTGAADVVDLLGSGFYNSAAQDSGTTHAAVYMKYTGTTTTTAYLGWGSDDDCKIYINGTLQTSFKGATGRGCSADTEFYGPITLTQNAWYRINMKVENGTGGYGLHLRLANANRTAITAFSTYVKDATAPSTPTSLVESGGATSSVWQNTDSSPTFTWTSGTDSQTTGEGVSGVRGQKYYFGTSSSTAPNTFQTGVSYAPGAQADGTYYFKVDTIDYALNESSVQTFVFKYDGTKPTNPSATCSDGLASGVWRTTSAPTFTLSGADDATSGLKTTGSNTRYKYYFGTSSSGAPVTGTDSTTIAPTLSGAGTYYLRVQTLDNAGNWSDAATVFTFNYAVPPAISTQPANQTACSGSTATFSVSASGPGLNYSWAKKGSGWGNAWSVSGTGGSFRASSTDNDSGDTACTSFSSASDINSPSGNALGMWGGASGDTVASRSFTALTSGQVVSVDVDNGNVDSGRKVGFSLQTSDGATDLLQFYFLGGQANYKYNDGTEKDTGIAFQRTGLRAQFVLGSGNTYMLIVTPCGGTAKYFSGSYASGSIAKVKLFNQNTTGGNDYNAYFNNLIVGGYADNADNYSGDYNGQDKGDAAIVSGNGSSTYTTPTLTSSDDGSLYQVVVYNAYGQVTSSAASLSINPSPGANSLERHRGEGASLKIKIADLITAPDIIQSLGSATHGTVSKDNTYVYYVPNAGDNNNDSFTYTAANTYSCTKQATINVTVDVKTGQAQQISVVGGKATMSFAGIPGYPYLVERAEDVNFTVNLTTVLTTNAPSDGLFTFEESTTLTEAYYRLKYNP